MDMRFGMEFLKNLWVRLTQNSCKTRDDVHVIFSKGTGSQTGHGWHRTSRRLYSLYGNGNENHQTGHDRTISE
jgi:hypothetical protein